MKVLEALAAPKAPTFSKAQMETVARQFDREWDEFGVKILVCSKCGGVVGKWHGGWTFLEGPDHQSIPYAIAKHVCRSREERRRQLRREMAQYAIDLREVHPELTRRQVKIARNKFYRYALKEENL